MNFKTLDRVVLPKEIKGSLKCFSVVNSRGNPPKVATCNTNGFMYEVKNRAIIRSLDLEDDPSSMSCYYLIERYKLVVFYLVYTASKRLLVIRSINKRLKVVKEYHDVREFLVYDFMWVGLPQIKINFLHKSECLLCDFPVRPLEVKFSEIQNTPPNFLSEELEDLIIHNDALTEEFNEISRMCFSGNKPTNVENISLTLPSFYLGLNNLTENRLIIQDKWFKVFDTSLILGMTLCNIGDEITDGLDAVISHEKIQDYTFSFFHSSYDISEYLFLPERRLGVLKPGEKIYMVGSFEIPVFYTESDLSIECYIASTNLKSCFVKETFDINVCDIALQTTLDLEDRFTVEDLLAILTAKTETLLRIQTEDFEDDLLESLLMKYLGFKLIKHMKDKLFYCTSSYLKEVFVALQHITKNPSVWKVSLYTSRERQVYFFVNALYDLLPENSAILCEESKV